VDLKLKALRRLALSLKESTGLFLYAQPCSKSFLKEKRKKESSLVVGAGGLSSFF